MGTSERLRRYWPLFGLELVTPRLRLSPLCDDDLPDIIDLVVEGIHDPDLLPFDTPWSLAPLAERVPNSLKHYWTQRAAVTPEAWEIQFAVHLDGVAIGIQALSAHGFAVARGVNTGSWIGLRHQGHGIGTEMRAAVLLFAFDELGAQRAESSAFVDNPKSNGVSARLGYQPNGLQWKERRPGEVAATQRLLVTPETFRRPDWTLGVSGWTECRSLLGL